jgi:Tfp pilus assembly protein PilV
MSATSSKVPHWYPVRKRTLSGQSLVEAVVAIGIALIVVTGLVVLAVGAVRSATLSRNRSVAVQYAQEGLEALRSVRDRDFTELPASGPNKLFWDGSQWNVLSGSDTIDLYSRSFTSSLVSSGKLKIVMTVGWADSAGSHSLDLTTYLTDWQ